MIARKGTIAARRKTTGKTRRRFLCRGWVGGERKRFILRGGAFVDYDQQETDLIVCQVQGEESSRNEVGLERVGLA
jgi:hypothetical protein